MLHVGAAGIEEEEEEEKEEPFLVSFRMKKYGLFV
jgi:hypothetical protein